jgi:hypothetical protein
VFTKNYQVHASFIKIILMKVTIGCEQIFHYHLHIYHLIWAKSDKEPEHNATEHLLIPSKSAQGRPHHFLGCKWNYIYLCTNILFSVSLSFLLLHHHSSLGIGAAISYKYCYSCVFKCPSISRLPLQYITQMSHYFSYFVLIKDHSWNMVGEDHKFWTNDGSKTPLWGTMQPI